MGLRAEEIQHTFPCPCVPWWKQLYSLIKWSLISVCDTTLTWWYSSIRALLHHSDNVMHFPHCSLTMECRPVQVHPSVTPLHLADLPPWLQPSVRTCHRAYSAETGVCSTEPSQRMRESTRGGTLCPPPASCSKCPTWVPRSWVSPSFMPCILRGFCPIIAHSLGAVCLTWTLVTPVIAQSWCLIWTHMIVIPWMISMNKTVLTLCLEWGMVYVLGEERGGLDCLVLPW